MKEECNKEGGLQQPECVSSLKTCYDGRGEPKMSRGELTSYQGMSFVQKWLFFLVLLFV